MIYKILPRAAWDEALTVGRYAGSPLDRAEGFIHFSASDQARETAAKHFAGQTDLVVLTVDTAPLGAALRWEPSRGGALFPHLYGPLDCNLVADVRAAPLGEDGVPVLGELAA